MEQKVKIGKKKYSVKATKRYSTIFYVAGIWLALSGIVSMPIGIVFLIIGAVLIYFGYAYHKAIKNSIIPDSSLNPSDDAEMHAEPPAAKIIESVNEEVAEKYEFLHIKVVGVTFKNGRKSRQAILRKIKFRDPPFEHEANIDLRKYEYEGEPACGIYANDEQIGNVPKDQVKLLEDNWNRIESVSALDIHGGGQTESGEQINYGAEITLKLLK